MATSHRPSAQPGIANAIDSPYELSAFAPFPRLDC
jgi:hypothetical protein